MNKFLELLGESVIFQGILVLLLAGAATYLWVTGMDVPDALVNLLMAIVGYFFGAKTTQAVQGTARMLAKYKEGKDA